MFFLSTCVRCKPFKAGKYTDGPTNEQTDRQEHRRTKTKAQEDKTKGDPERSHSSEQPGGMVLVCFAVFPCVLSVFGLGVDACCFCYVSLFRVVFMVGV